MSVPSLEFLIYQRLWEVRAAFNIIACVMTFMCLFAKYFWKINVFFIYQRLW